MWYSLPLLSKVIRSWDSVYGAISLHISYNYNFIIYVPSHSGVLSLSIHIASHFARSGGMGSTAIASAMRAKVGKNLFPQLQINIVLVGINLEETCDWKGWSLAEGHSSL